MRVSRRITIVVALLSLSACESPSALEDDDRLLETSEQEYVLVPEGDGLSVSIPFTFHNGTGSTVYLVNCGGAVPPALERQYGDEWRVEWTPIVPLCLSPAITIPSNETFSYTLDVWGAFPGSNAAPAFESSDPEGTYRLRWGVALSSYDPDGPPFGDPLPLEWRVSNTFRLTRQ